MIAGLADVDGPAWELLTERVGVDSNRRLRLAAVRMLVDRFGVKTEVAEILLDRVRADPDAEVLREAAIALTVHLGTDLAQCRALTGRADSEDAPVRCVTVRILGE